jgi:hypothetical protein
MSASDKSRGQPPKQEGRDFLKRTATFWQNYRCVQLSDDEAHQIAANTAGFFAILAEWAEKETAARSGTSSVKL